MKIICPVSIMLLLFFLFVSGCIENKPTAVTEISTPISTPLPKQYLNMDFKQFDKAMSSTDKLTELQKQDFYDSFVGKYVQWRLKVLDVDQNSISLHEGTGKIRLFVTNDQIPKLATLNKGDIITIEGLISEESIAQIRNYNMYFYAGINLYEGKIISKG